MRSIKKTTTVLRAIGIVLIFLAVLLSIYALAGNGQWENAASRMQRAGLDTGIMGRMRFDHDYYLALSDAVSDLDQPDSARSSRAAGQFAEFVDEEEKALGKLLDDRAEEAIASLSQEFDSAAFLERFERHESLVEQKKAASLISDLDAIFASQASGPKNKPFLKNSTQNSCSQTAESFYETLTEEQGTTAGSYSDFLTAVTDMIKQDMESGIKVTSLDTWFNEAFDPDRYFTAIRSIQSLEMEETGHNLLNAFAEKIMEQQTGEAVDWHAFMNDAYESFLSETGDGECGKAEFVIAFTGLLDNSSFTGETSEIMSAVEENAVNNAADSFSDWLPSLGNEIVKEANARSKIGVVNVFWRMTANLLWFWFAGILLLVLAAVIGKLLDVYLVRAMNKKELTADLAEDELLRVSHLKQYFKSGSYVNKAVDDVSFSIRKGEVFGLVGESGCGKTTTGRTIINLYDPTDGDVYFQGLRVSSTKNGLSVLTYQLRRETEEKIRELKADLAEEIKKEPERKRELTEEYREKIRGIRKELSEHIADAQKHALESAAEKSCCVQKYREKRQTELTAAYEQDRQNLSGEALEERKRKYEVEMKVAGKDNIMTRMQMVFQDPIASINPRMTVRQIIAEGLIVRGIKDQKYIDEKVYEMLELVGLVREHADRYPHEFSGGQRQRIGIARAIAMEPDLIIADEPISALDVSIQAQVINLMNDLRKQMGLTIMFIAHNLSVVKYFSDRIGVMYYGHMVELATSDELFAHPLHPYTKSLLSAIPYPDPHHEKNRKRIEYNPNTAHDYAVQQPVLHEIVPGHFILCNDAELEKYRKELELS